MKTSAIVFDLDDTLYAERDFAISGFAAADNWLYATHGVGGLKTAAVEVLDAGFRGDIFNRALLKLDCDVREEWVPELVRVYRNHRPEISLRPEAASVLEYFKGRKLLGLLTDGYAGTQRNKVAALGIEAHFDVIVFTDEFGRDHWKPSEAGFRLIMERLKLPGEACAYVGDNVLKDFLAPNALGWSTVHILRDDGEYCRAKPASAGHAADWSIRSLCELREIFA